MHLNARARRRCGRRAHLYSVRKMHRNHGRHRQSRVPEHTIHPSAHEGNARTGASMWSGRGSLAGEMSLICRSPRHRRLPVPRPRPRFHPRPCHHPRRPPVPLTLRKDRGESKRLSRTRTDLRDLRRRHSPRTYARINSLAAQFVFAILERQLPMASFLGFLMIHKPRPFDALEDNQA